MRRVVQSRINPGQSRLNIPCPFNIELIPFQQIIYFSSEIYCLDNQEEWHNIDLSDYLLIIDVNILILSNYALECFLGTLNFCKKKSKAYPARARCPKNLRENSNGLNTKIYDIKNSVNYPSVSSQIFTFYSIITLVTSILNHAKNILILRKNLYSSLIFGMSIDDAPTIRHTIKGRSLSSDAIKRKNSPRELLNNQEWNYESTHRNPFQQMRANNINILIINRQSHRVTEKQPKCGAKIFGWSDFIAFLQAVRSIFCFYVVVVVEIHPLCM